MALLRDYEILGTGLVAPNAYHVVTNVRVNKRTQDIPAPPDVNHPSGFTNGGQRDEDAVYWKAGYIGEISVTVWKDQEARENGSNPLGYIGFNPTDVEMPEGHIGTPGMNHKCKFFIDMASGVDYTTQAYNHLKSLDYYADATEV